MSLPVIHHLSAYRGDTWSQVFRLVKDGAPEDLTGATVESEARSPSGTITALVITVEDAADGRIKLEMPPDFLAGSYQYDVEVTKGGEVKTWIRGNLSLTPDVTNSVVIP